MANGQLPIKYDNLYKFVMSVGLLIIMAGMATLLYSIAVNTFIAGIVFSIILFILGLALVRWAFVRWRIKQRTLDRLEMGELYLAAQKVKAALKDKYEESLFAKEDPVEHLIKSQEES